MANIKKIKIGSTSYDLAATYDKNGNDITSTYLPKTGGGLTGHLTLTESKSLIFKASSDAGPGQIIYKDNANAEIGRLWFSANNLIFRAGDSSATSNKVLHSGNYTDYTVTKTGGGASGSWGINITGSSASCTGNAATATKLATTRSISLIGDIAGSANFNGSANASIATAQTQKAINSSFQTNFRSQVFDKTDNGSFLRTIRCDTANVAGAPQYGSGIGWGTYDTHGYLYVNYNSAEAYIGGGNESKIKWYKKLSFSDHTHSYLPLSGGTLTGALYLNNNNNHRPAVLIKENNYWGLKDPSGGNDWIRTTTNGLIPNQSGGPGAGHCSLGTNTWYFSAAYIDNIYGYLNGNISGSSASCRGNAATATSATSATKSNALSSTGFGNASPGEFTYFASSSAFAGYSGGWAHYLIANHGNGSNYYNWIMVLPFGGSPLYRRMNGGTWQDFQYFITTENQKTYQNKLYNIHNDGISTVGTYCVTKGSVLSFEPCDEVTSYNINLGRNTSGKKFNNIYLKASAINGSDIRLKKDLSKLLDDERYIQLFDLIEPYAYKFIDGTSGRIHTGFISQYVEDAMKQVGLNSNDCAFFCKDIETKNIYDENGDIIKTEPILDENGDIVYNYALRYGEYIAITAAKIKSLEKQYNQKFENQEKRISELEDLVLKLIENK